MVRRGWEKTIALRIRSVNPPQSPLSKGGGFVMAEIEDGEAGMGKDYRAPYSVG